MSAASPERGTLANVPFYVRGDFWMADLDPGIRFAVRVLDAAGIETYESCQGGPGHAYIEPTVAFHGGPSEGHRAYAAVMAYGLPVHQLNRFWRLSEGELDGPKWQLTFRRTMEDRADERLMFITSTQPNPAYEFPE